MANSRIQTRLLAMPIGQFQADWRPTSHTHQAPVTKPIAVQLGFASDELGYLIDLGIPQSDPSLPNPFARDPEIKREQVFAGAVAKPATLLLDRLRARTRVRDGRWTSLDQALALLDIMDFQHKDIIEDKIRKNATMYQMLAQYMQMALTMAMQASSMMHLQL